MCTRRPSSSNSSPASYTKPTIGDFIESLLGWYIYWTAEENAEFDDIVHLVVDNLNRALLNTFLFLSSCKAFSQWRRAKAFSQCRRD